MSQQAPTVKKEDVPKAEGPPKALADRVKGLAEQWGTSEDHVWEMMSNSWQQSGKENEFTRRMNTARSLGGGGSQGNQPQSLDQFERMMDRMMMFYQGGGFQKGNGNSQDIDMNKIFLFGMMKSMFSTPPMPQSSIPPELLIALTGNKPDDKVMLLLMEDRKAAAALDAENRRESNAMMNTMMQGVLGKSKSEMEELIKSQGAEHKLDLEKVRGEFVARMGAGGDPNSMDNIAMSAWREQMTERIKDMVKRGFIPEKDIVDEKGNLKPEAVFDKVIGLGKEFFGMVSEFARNQPTQAPPPRVPVSIPVTGPVPQPGPQPAAAPAPSGPPANANAPPPTTAIPVTSPITEHNGMEIIGIKVKATTPRQ